MPYYGQGDYYMAGDPGLFSAIGGLLKRAGGAAAGFLTGGAVGAVRGAISPGSVFGQTPGAPSLPSIRTPSVPQVAMQLTGAAMSAVTPHASADGIPPRGYHLNKSGYFLKSGEYVAPRSRYVRNRSRNPLNPRALRKSISRVSGFTGYVKRSRKSLKSLGSL